jgi:hypothetical protein
LQAYSGVSRHDKAAVNMTAAARARVKRLKAADNGFIFCENQLLIERVPKDDARNYFVR